MTSLPSPVLPSTRRVQRVRHDLKRRELQVTRVAEVGRHFRSVTFHGESLADFQTLSFDDHVKFLLSDTVRRDYTPRHFDRDRCELTIEFALHGAGPAANWARHAAPGQSAVIGGPKGSMIIPMDYDWHVLVGDETALPAISRRLEELPAGSRVTVIGQVGDREDRRSLDSAANVSTRWVTRDDELIAAVRELALPTGEGFVWCAGEARAMAEVRRLVIDVKGHDRQAIRASAYWKQGASGHHENLE